MLTMVTVGSAVQAPLPQVSYIKVHVINFVKVPQW